MLFHSNVPSALLSRCVVTAMGAGGKDKDGLPIDKGECVFSGIRKYCCIGQLGR